MWRPLTLALLAFVACSKADPSSSPNAAPSASTPTAGLDAAPPVAAAMTWTGAYESKAGTLYVPDGGEWAGTKWRGDVSPDALGGGTLTVSIDPKTGKATGTSDGPIGPGVINGSLAEGQLTASLTRKDVTDNGFTGVLLGNVVSDKLDGVIHGASGDAHTIRSITFSLAKK